MRLLLLSNSINPGGAYLQHALAAVEKINRRRAIFIPYAGVTIGWDDYLNKVRQALAPIGIHVDGVHQSDDPVAAIQGAELILVGCNSCVSTVCWKQSVPRSPSARHTSAGAREPIWHAQRYAPPTTCRSSIPKALMP